MFSFFPRMGSFYLHNNSEFGYIPEKKTTEITKTRKTHQIVEKNVYRMIFHKNRSKKIRKNKTYNHISILS